MVTEDFFENATKAFRFGAGSLNESNSRPKFGPCRIGKRLFKKVTESKLVVRMCDEFGHVSPVLLPILTTTVVAADN